MNHKNRFYKKVTNDFKYFLSCFTSFNDRLVEGYVHKCGSSSFINIGFKYLIKAKASNFLTESSLLKIIKLETFFDELNVDCVNLHNDLNRRLSWAVIRKASENRCFVIGRILNKIRGGFSIGICGFVGYMPKRYSISPKKEITSLFIINNINLSKKSFVVSQRQLHKIASRTLFKLSSQIIFVSKH